jgi:hypothetical protein
VVLTTIINHFAVGTNLFCWRFAKKTTIICWIHDADVVFGGVVE